MATDSAGYNTSSAFQATNYDPTSLVSGLQSAATYDPSTQSTTTPTSAARFLSGGLNSVNNTQQDNASTTQNTSASAATAAPATTAATTGLTTASNNTVNKSYAAQAKWAPTAGTITGGTAPTTTTPAATTTTGGLGIAYAGAAAQQAATNALTPYTGSAVVAVHITDDGYSYYKFNSTTGQYQYVGTYTTSGPLASSNPYINSGAQVMGYNDAVHDSDNGVGYVTAAQQSAITSWNKANQAQAATNAATAVTTAGTNEYNSVMNYLTTHGGQLDANTQAILNNTYSGNAGVQQAQQAAIKKAQTDYAAQAAHAAQLTSIGMKPIDTSATDNTNTAALNSLISQYASQGGGANANVGSARSAAYAAASLQGQGVLSHDTAAATSYNSNMTNFANALKTQNTADASATGNQLYSDIQNVQQIASQLQQEMGQLSTSHQQAAQAQLDQLNQLVNNYQQAVAQYGQGSGQAMQIATGILSAAGAVAGAV